MVNSMEADLDIEFYQGQVWKEAFDVEGYTLIVAKEGADLKYRGLYVWPERAHVEVFRKVPRLDVPGELADIFAEVAVLSPGNGEFSELYSQAEALRRAWFDFTNDRKNWPIINEILVPFVGEAKILETQSFGYPVSGWSEQVLEWETEKLERSEITDVVFELSVYEGPRHILKQTDEATILDLIVAASYFSGARQPEKILKIANNIIRDGRAVGLANKSGFLVEDIAADTLKFLVMQAANENSFLKNGVAV